MKEGRAGKRKGRRKEEERRRKIVFINFGRRYN